MFSLVKKMIIRVRTLFRAGDKKKSPKQVIKMKGVGGNANGKNIVNYQNEKTKKQRK